MYACAYISSLYGDIHGVRKEQESVVETAAEKLLIFVTEGKKLRSQIEEYFSHEYAYY